eukprot:5585307-Ditylum_brightwellii.AAC.1
MMTRDWTEQIRQLFPGHTTDKIVMIIVGLDLNKDANKHTNSQANAPATSASSMLDQQFHSPADDALTKTYRELYTTFQLATSAPY